MATGDNAVFLELLEWFDESGEAIIHRLPAQGSGDIKFGAQLIVRESQAGVLFYQGKACDGFGPGRHTLKTGNIPILTKLLSVPWGMNSPLRAEVYFVNLKVFSNLKWGTRDPVAFRDQELGLIRLRAHGIFNLRVLQPVLFINTMVGTMGQYGAADIEAYWRRLIVSRFNDYLGEQLDTVFNLPGRFAELARGLKTRLVADFSRFGLALDELVITSITPPPEVQEAIDDQGRMKVIGDMDKFVRMKAAMAVEKAAVSGGEAASGLGLGLGMMMPAMFGNVQPTTTVATPASPASTQTIQCPDCHHQIGPDARFCPFCGHQQVILAQCANCGKNLTSGARFCSRCGHSAAEKPVSSHCSGCGTENLPGASYCNQCGEKI